VWKDQDIPILSVMTAADEHLVEGKICSHMPAMFRSKNMPRMGYCNAYTLMMALSHLGRERTYNKEWN